MDPEAKRALALGAAAGTFVVIGGWLLFEAKIRATLQAEVPPLVERQLAETLSAVGLDARTGTRTASLLANLERVGVI
jgi:hypothetical protein